MIIFCALNQVRNVTKFIFSNTCHQTKKMYAINSDLCLSKKKTHEVHKKLWGKTWCERLRPNKSRWFTQKRWTSVNNLICDTKHCLCRTRSFLLFKEKNSWCSVNCWQWVTSCAIKTFLAAFLIKLEDVNGVHYKV